MQGESMTRKRTNKDRIGIEHPHALRCTKKWRTPQEDTDFFTIGSSKNQVLETQGTPDSFSDDAFQYGSSSVYFDKNNRVISWHNGFISTLKAKLLPRPEWDGR